MEQQSDRFLGLIERLRVLRANRLYPALKGPQGDSDTSAVEASEKSMLEEIPSSRSSSSDSSRASGDGRLPDLTHLTSSLRSLHVALTSTSTTRTSLLSTLESYTSHLHREIYLRGPSSNNGHVGLGTLGANLRSESGEGAGRGEEWDKVRKEVRAIKGMLLGRRNFPVVHVNGGVGRTEGDG